MSVTSDAPTGWLHAFNRAIEKTAWSRYRTDLDLTCDDRAVAIGERRQRVP